MHHGSLNNPSRANGDFREQIFARDCNNSGETEEVCYITMLGVIVVPGFNASSQQTLLLSPAPHPIQC